MEISQDLRVARPGYNLPDTSILLRFQANQNRPPNQHLPLHDPSSARVTSPPDTITLSTHVTVPERPNHPQRRAPAVALLLRIPLADPYTRQLLLPLRASTRTLQEGVCFVAPRPEFHTSHETLVQGIQERLEGDGILVRRGWCSSVFLRQRSA